MLIKIKIKTAIKSEPKANELYCVLFSKYPTLFNPLEEDTFKYRFKNLNVSWSGNIPNVKEVKYKIVSDKLNSIFENLGIKKCKYEIFANNQSYKFIYKKEKKKNEIYKRNSLQFNKGNA